MIDCIVDRDLSAYLDREAGIETDYALIDRWVANEYCRVTGNGGAIYDEYFTEAVHGAGHEIEHGSLSIAMLNAGTIQQKLDALYEYNCKIEEWFMAYLKKQADDNREQILTELNNEQYRC